MSDIATNRKALRDYHITERTEAGIVLNGTEVKSIRAGHIQLADAFARIDDGLAKLHGCHIQPYNKASHTQHEPLRPKTLLLHKKEIRKLAEASHKQGATLVALRLYWKGAKVKVELGVGKGKNKGDRRDDEKMHDMKRDAQRAMSAFNQTHRG